MSFLSYRINNPLQTNKNYNSKNSISYITLYQNSGGGESEEFTTTAVF